MHFYSICLPAVEVMVSLLRLSPEILLKRPNVDGKWRMDHLLKRKAVSYESYFEILHHV